MKADNIVDTLRHYSELTPSKMAYRFIVSDQCCNTMTYQELYSNVSNLACDLMGMAESGSRVLIMSRPGLEYIISCYACFMAGMIAVPLYMPRRDAQVKRLALIIEDCDPQIILVDAKNLKRANSMQQAHVWLNSIPIVLVSKHDNPMSSQHFASPKADDIAVLQYTSGSTGKPKAVMVTHKNFVANSKGLKFFAHSNEESKIVTWLPPYHDMGLGAIIQSLCNGAEAILMSPFYFVQKPIRWLKAVSDFKGTIITGNNFSYQLCVDRVSLNACEELQINLESLQVAFVGSEVVRYQTLKIFAEKFAKFGLSLKVFLPCYGLAEATLMVSGIKLDEEPKEVKVNSQSLHDGRVEFALSKDNEKSFVSCGSVLPGHELDIVDSMNGRQCEANEVGEIWFSGDSVAKGYWGDSEKTSAVFGAKINGGEKCYLRTGDLGFMYKGELYVCGRIKSLIIIRGKNYYANDMEYCAYVSHDSVCNNGCAAFSIEQDNDEKLVILAELERAQYTTEQLKQIVSMIRENIAQTYDIQPSIIVLVRINSLPKTSSGKIRRFACKDELINRKLAVIFEWRDKKVEKSKHEAVDKQESASFNPRSSEIADDLISWFRDYSGTRVNSRLFDERRCIPPYIYMDFADKGLMGLVIPKEYGGLNLAYTDIMRIAEQISAVDISLAVMLGYHSFLGCRPLVKFGQKSMKAKLLPRLAKGREFCAFAVTEPIISAGELLQQTTAKQGKNGDWVLNGIKRWNFSGWANSMHVLCSTPEKDNPSHSHTLFTVNRNMPGVSTGPEALTMGFRGLLQCALMLKDVKIDRSNMLGKVGEGYGIAQDALAISRLGIATVCLGAMKRCAQLMYRYTSRRETYTGKLIQQPVIARNVSKLVAEITAHEAFIYQITELVDQGVSLPWDIFMAVKVSASEVGAWAADMLVQYLGGRGYMENNIAPRILRDIRVMRIVEGPTEQLTTFIGRSAIESDTIQDILVNYLDAKKISDTLKVNVNRVYECNLKRCSSKFHALLLTHHVSGLLAIKSMLLASCYLNYKKEPTDHNKLVVTYVEKQLSEMMVAFTSGDSNETVLADRSVIDALVKSYEQSIGDVEQHCPGEDLELDPMLRRDESFSQGGVRSPSIRGEKIDHNVTRKEVVLWIKQWVLRNLDVTLPEDINDVSIFSLGFDSIYVVRLSVDLQKHFNISLDPSALLEYVSIQEISEHVVAVINELYDNGEVSKNESVMLAPDSYESASLKQEEFVYFEERIQNSSVENMIMLVGIVGEIDIALLQKSINQVVQKNSVLRSSYTNVQEPKIIINEFNYEAEFVDFSDNSDGFVDLLAKMCKHNFDIKTAPLFQIKLLKREARNYQLVLIFHHIIIDPLSIRYFVEDMVDYYKRNLIGEVVSHEQVRPSFLDFSYAQRKLVNDKASRAELHRFWQEKLGDAPSCLLLPLDFERKVEFSAEATYVPIDLSSQSSAIHRYVSQHNTTAFRFLLSIYNVLLYWYSSEKDIVVGVPSAIRNQAGFERTIGLFVTIIPYRIQLNPDETFEQLLLSVDNAAISIAKYSDITNNELVEILKPEISQYYNPIFQVMFSYFSGQLSPLKVGNITFQPSVEYTHPPVGLDMYLALYDDPEQGIKGAFQYDSTILSRDTIKHLLHHYKTLVDVILANPQTKIEALQTRLGSK